MSLSRANELANELMIMRYTIYGKIGLSFFSWWMDIIVMYDIKII
jgi:hypothetical protein